VNGNDQCSGVGSRRALATSEFPGCVALTEQLPRIGLTVSEAVCRDSWRVFRIRNLLCCIDWPESPRSRHPDTCCVIDRKGGLQATLRNKSGVKKTLIYTYLGIMLASLFGAGSLPRSYQEPVVLTGLFLMGLLLVAGVPIVWYSKTPLRGRGVNIEFSRHPFLYAILVIFVLIFGGAIIGYTVNVTSWDLFGIEVFPFLPHK
jgi:hypothetical protein